MKNFLKTALGFINVLILTTISTEGIMFLYGKYGLRVFLYAAMFTLFFTLFLKGKDS